MTKEELNRMFGLSGGGDGANKSDILIYFRIVQNALRKKGYIDTDSSKEDVSDE